MATLEPEPGISEALAIERAAVVSDVRYALTLVLPLDRTAAIPAESVVSFTLSEPARALLLDFAPNANGRLISASCNDSPLDTTLICGHIVVPPGVVRAGRNAVRVLFDAGDGPLNRRDDHLYSIFVPARAHEAFPCFDQPDLKARFTLTLDLPAAWTAVSNAGECARHDHRDATGGERLRVEFDETEPIPTYLFAFAAGPFLVEGAIRDGRPMRMFHLESDADVVARNRDAIIDAHAEALAWLADYTAVPYPFATFDIVLLPAFQFGGMEHPGAIFYHASTLLLDASATRQQLLARAHVIAHETAHMWFGDLVTMRWFSDVWMKEVFANTMAAKILSQQFPALDHDLRFLHAHHPAAYDIDRSAGTNPIRQPLDNLLDAGSLYGPIVYLKSPIVMRQLERLLGAELFRRVLREYLQQYRFGNASWPDLLALIERHAAFDVRAWSHAWIDEPGRPTIRPTLEVTDGIITRLTLRASDSLPGRALIWPQQFDVALGYGATVDRLSITLDTDADVDVTAARGRPAPDYVLPNASGFGYGNSTLNAASLRWLIAHLPSIADPLTRATAWLTLWDATLDGDVAPTALTDLAIAALPRETNELNVQRILSHLERLFWIFDAPEERTARAAALEAALRACIMTSEAVTTKAVFLAAYRSMATTRTALDWLRALWRNEATVPGLSLSEADHVLLAQELAARGADDGDAVVAEQLERTVSAERRAALAFVASALSSDPQQRDRFFNSLREPAQRRREPWVIDGLRWLHHPVRAGSSVRYIEPGLSLLEEIQRTGDIFLPARWAAATLSGHQTPEAASSVASFLERLPAGYPAPLRRIVCAAADQLFRAAGTRMSRMRVS